MPQLNIMRKARLDDYAIVLDCGQQYGSATWDFDKQRHRERADLASRTVWCGQEDSNFHGLSPTTTSTLRVYQFRHGRTRPDR
jgi:hypothetical protein